MLGLTKVSGILKGRKSRPPVLRECKVSKFRHDPDDTRAGDKREDVPAVSPARGKSNEPPWLVAVASVHDRSPRWRESAL